MPKLPFILNPIIPLPIFEEFDPTQRDQNYQNISSLGIEVSYNIVWYLLKKIVVW